MNIEDFVKNWKITIPTVTATAAVLLWLLGAEFPRPVFAAEYQSDLKELNLKQLQSRKEFVQDKIERYDEQLLHLEEKAWDVQRTGQSMPEYLPKLKLKVSQERENLEQVLEDIHTQEIQLAK